jgi:hypothetical protein
MAKLKTAQDQSDEGNENEEKQQSRDENQHDVILDVAPNVRASDLSENCGSQVLP